MRYWEHLYCFTMCVALPFILMQNASGNYEQKLQIWEEHLACDTWTDDQKMPIWTVVLSFPSQIAQ